jgi:hypothetical protein
LGFETLNQCRAILIRWFSAYETNVQKIFFRQFKIKKIVSPELDFQNG